MRDLVEGVDWTRNTGLSAALLTRPAARGYDVVEEPIRYGDRLGDAELDPIEDGAGTLASTVEVCTGGRLQ